MAYIRNPVYMWTSVVGDEKRDDDTFCVSLPRGSFRGDPDGCDFRRIELLALALAFLDRDYPEMITEAGSETLRKICKDAEAALKEGWKKQEKILREFQRRDPEQIMALLEIGLNPEDWCEDMVEFSDQEPEEDDE